MRSTNDINTDINQTETEVKELEQRKDELDGQLSEIKNDYRMLLNADKVQDKISNITTNRGLISEAIQERYDKLEQLQAKLEKAESEEVRQQRFQRCIDLAHKADMAAQEYREFIEELDYELVDKLITIAESQRAWQDSSKQFINIAQQLEPAIKVNSTGDMGNRPELEEAAKRFIQDIEEQEVSTDAVLSEIYVDERHYRIRKRNGREVKPSKAGFES